MGITMSCAWSSSVYPIEQLMDIAFHTKVNLLLCMWPSTTLKMAYYLLHIKVWRNKDTSKRESQVCISNQVIQEKTMEAKEKKAPSYKCGASRQIKRSRPQLWATKLRIVRAWVSQRAQAKTVRTKKPRNFATEQVCWIRFQLQVVDLSQIPKGFGLCFLVYFVINP